MKKLAAALLALGLASSAFAQAYPEKPVRLVVPFPAGAPADIMARVVTAKVSEGWGKPIVLDHVPGMVGSIGADRVSKAPADGYTLLVSGDAAMTTNVTLYPALAYHPLKHLAPITLAVESTNILAVHPSLPVNSVEDLVALAKSRPGKLSYASSGSGSSQHLAGELFKAMASVDIVHVPYKSAPQVMQDLLGGRVAFNFANVAVALPHVKEGRLRGLAVSSRKRWPSVPNLPTMQEAGLADFEAIAWFGFLAPAGTPAQILEKLHRDITAALALPEVRGRLSEVGLEVVASSATQFEQRIRDEIVSKGELVRRSGAKAD
jgi:tripartite-type tricarboxylate transporter receptor subunit TctC